MSNIRPEIRTALQNFIDLQDEYNTKEDVLRAFEEEAMLMKETETTLSILELDPMGSGVKPQIQRLKKLMRVTSCSRVRAGSDYCRIEATILFEKCNNMQLTFRYERNRRQDNDGNIISGFLIRYTIEMSVNYQQRESIITLEIHTHNNSPSSEKAVCMNQAFEDEDEGEGDDGWEDIEDGDDDAVRQNVEELTIEKDTTPTSKGLDLKSESSGTSQKQKNGDAKRQKLNDNNNINGETNLPTKDGGSTSDEPDSYLAHIDPDVLHKFLNLAGLKNIDECASFFLLMTFPFYEQEWDLVGYLYETIFEQEEEEDE
ncbi:MAG: hypothetical protein ACI8RD_002487 [Bacillariaceae sp.]|jgi:hypothetical protein